MPFTRLLLHAVWAVKDRKPLMRKPDKDAVCAHIRDNAKAKGIHLLNINGWHEHLHGLFSLTTSQNVETVVNLIKGESSHWARRNLQWTEEFGWQDDYFAVSVSPSLCQLVYDYIERQEIHHLKKSFAEEFEEFMRDNHIDPNNPE